MAPIIILYLIGVICAICALSGAAHCELPSVFCLIFATRLLQDWRELRKELRR